MVYINEFDKQNVYEIDEIFIPVNIVPYDSYYTVNDYTWRNYMAYWCGFRPWVKDSAEFENLDEVKEMPCYPESGSIKKINGAIVVKFADSEQE